MYLKLDTLTQCTESEIRAAFPSTSFPQPFVVPDGYAVLFAAPQPAYDPITQAVRQGTPVLTDKGHWEQTWQVVDLDAETAAANAESARKARVPQSVTMRQARLAMLDAGLLDTINQTIATITPPEMQKRVAIEWEYAQTVDRGSEWVEGLRPALGLSVEELDNLFIAAAAL